jgi:hypothetical protein
MSIVPAPESQYSQIGLHQADAEKGVGGMEDLPTTYPYQLTLTALTALTDSNRPTWVRIRAEYAETGQFCHGQCATWWEAI